MSNEILIDATHQEETRVAIVKNKRLEDYDYEFSSRRPIRGNIYLAKVIRVEPSLQAAFLEYGGNRNAFLPFSEISPDYYQIPVEDKKKLKDLEKSNSLGNLEEDEISENHTSIDNIAGDKLEENEVKREKPYKVKYKIQEVIKKHQIVLIQIAKEERGNKGAAATTYISIPGRYCVLMPNSGRGGGISRRINNSQERKKIKKILEKLTIPNDMGLIIRTAGGDTTQSEIRKDYNYLIKVWNKIREETLSAKAPNIIYEDGSIIKKTIRDSYTKEIDRIYVDGDEKYKVAKNFMKMIMPSHAVKVQKWKEDAHIFQRDKIEEQLNSIFSEKVSLKSGGSLVINQTEALVAIDVNSGTSKKDYNIEDTAVRTNQEAAQEIARQLRLRDMAGLVVIDFIDMEKFKNRGLIEKKLKESLRSDRSKIQVGRISSFGLLEMSRQRIRSSVQEENYDVCPTCNGSGSLRSMESISIEFFRNLNKAVKDERATKANVEIPLDLLNFIINGKRELLSGLEKENEISISLTANNTLRGEEKNITLYDKNLNKLALKKNDEIRKNNKNRKKPQKSQIKEKTKNEEKKTNIKEKDSSNTKSNKNSKNKDARKKTKEDTNKIEEVKKTKGTKVEKNNDNYIGAPVKSNKDTKANEKKDGWWNK